MRWRRAAVPLLVLLLVAAGCSRHQPAPVDGQVTTGDRQGFLTVDGRRRSFLLHLPPAYQLGAPLPLVVMLHGGGGDARNAERMTGWSDKADQDGLIVVYPNGTGRLGDRLLTWNAGDCCAYAQRERVDDVRFIAALLDQLQRELRVDPTRILATGMSNGGMLAYTLGCRLAPRLAVIAPVAGALHADCHPAAPLSVVAFHGTDDRNVRYGGGPATEHPPGQPRVDPPVHQTIALWARHDGCPPSPSTTVAGTVVFERYRPCRERTEVELVTIKGQGHAWPGGERGTPRGDTPTRAVSATDLIADFLKAHPKAGPGP